MLVNNHISKDFIPPNLSNKGGFALDLLQDFNLTHIPVIENGELIGNLPKEVLENFSVERNLMEIKDYAEDFSINENASFFDAVREFNNNASNILPVINGERQYLGFFAMEDMISALSTMPFIVEPGAIMTVEVAQKQFSISEVAKIVESNNSRIIGLFITAHQADKVQITLKLISDNLVSVSETFERFGYSVVHKFFNDEKEDLIKDRFQQLMKYLDI